MYETNTAFNAATDELHPMDLIVHIVLKSEMRKLRIAMVFDSLQHYRTLLTQWSIAKAKCFPLE